MGAGATRRAEAPPGGHPPLTGPSSRAALAAAVIPSAQCRGPLVAISGREALPPFHISPASTACLQVRPERHPLPVGRAAAGGQTRAAPQAQASTSTALLPRTMSTRQAQLDIFTLTAVYSRQLRCQRRLHLAPECSGSGGRVESSVPVGLLPAGIPAARLPGPAPAVGCCPCCQAARLCSTPFLLFASFIYCFSH